MTKRPGSRPNQRGNQHGSLSRTDAYRLLIHWPNRPEPSTFRTSDRARARSVARRKATAGATVAFQEHENWGVYRTTRTYTPTDKDHTP